MKHYYGNVKLGRLCKKRYTLRFEVKWNARRFKESLHKSRNNTNI